MSRFRPIDRKTACLLPPSVDDWLPQDHRARFIVEAIEQLDLSEFTRAYAGRGATPTTLKSCSALVYGYATATFSSRRIERATYDSVAFRHLAAGSHPDHDTLANFRRRFLDELSSVFLQVLELASEMKLLERGCFRFSGFTATACPLRVKLGTASLDGTKLHANLSRHSALSHGHIAKLETQRKAEVQELLALAEQADQKDVPDGVNLPEEIKRREDRLALMAAAKSKIAARAKVRFEAEQAAYAAKLAQRAARTAETGDKQQVGPMLDTLAALPASLGKVDTLLADTGYCSAANIAACEAARIEPYIAVAREDHHPDWCARFTEPAPLATDATPTQKMAHKRKTKLGRMLYALRKQTVEPVFGIIKSAMGFRQFLLRGLEKAKGEWTLVCLACNLKRMAVLRQKSVRCA